MPIMSLNCNFVLIAIAPDNHSTPNRNPYLHLIRGTEGDRRSLENEIVADINALEEMLE
jgi:hypothetical protein